MRTGRAIRLFLVSAAAAAVAACTVGPDFRQPAVASPPVWGGEPTDVRSATVAEPVDGRWWNSFGDPELSSLVGRLVRQNLDLQSAAERVRQADAQRQITRSEGLPHIDEQSHYLHERFSPNGFISLVQPAPFAPLVFDDWENQLSASWEIDLFGRVRRAVEAQRANTVAAVEARHAVALDALANLAEDYMQLRGTQRREAIAEANLDLAKRDLTLVQSQLANGVGTTLNLANAQATVAAITATLPGLLDTEARTINAIGFLLAEPPRALASELAGPGRQPIVPPVVPVGLPSELVTRRPDVREAAASLHAATAETGVAVASFYPDISLTGQFGGDGRIIGNAFSLPSRAFTVGPQLDLPLFQGGRLVGTLRLRRSQQREAAIAYRDTVLGAWQDVDNALTSYAEAQRTRTEIAGEVRQDEAALGAARQSFTEGAIDFLNVISAQTALLQSEDQLAESDVAVETDLVALYKALGGGWDVADAGLRVAATGG